MANIKDVLLQISLCLIFCIQASGTMHGFTTKASSTIRDQMRREEEQFIPRLQSKGSPRCGSCGKKEHDYAKTEALNCVPPPHVLQFGEYTIPKDYRDALFESHPHYTSKQIVRSFLGHGIFPSYDDWKEQQEEEQEEEEEEDNSNSWGGPRCGSCGKKEHDYAKTEALNCVPPPHVLQFGEYTIPKDYRDALFESHPHYTSEEVVGSYLGHGIFPSYDDWKEQQEEEQEEEQQEEEQEEEDDDDDDDDDSNSDSEEEQ